MYWITTSSNNTSNINLLRSVPYVRNRWRAYCDRMDDCEGVWLSAHTFCINILKITFYIIRTLRQTGYISIKNFPCTISRIPWQSSCYPGNNSRTCIHYINMNCRFCIIQFTMSKIATGCFHPSNNYLLSSASRIAYSRRANREYVDNEERVGGYTGARSIRIGKVTFHIVFSFWQWGHVYAESLPFATRPW